MKPFTFIHAADLHLDTPFTGIGKVDLQLQQRLRDASLDAFDNLIRAAIKRRVEFVVIAGDIYDGAERGVRAQARFVAGMRELARYGIDCFFIHGNHDPVEEGWTALHQDDFPTSAVLIDECEQVRSMPVRRGDETIAVVHGISFRSREETRNLSLLFPEVREDQLFHIGLLHCNVGGQAGHYNYAPCTVDDLSSRAIDYWALGHIHERKILRSSAPCIVYPGNLQARRFDECGPKGATIVHVHSGGEIETEMLELDEVRFAHLPVDVENRCSLDEVLSECIDVIVERSPRNHSKLLLVRLTVSGQTVAHQDLLTAQMQDELLPAIRDRLKEQDVWLDKLIIRTIPVADRTVVGQSQGFGAALIELVNSLRQSDAESVALQNDVREPLFRGVRYADYITRENALPDAKDVIDRAEARLLGMLQNEGRQ